MTKPKIFDHFPKAVTCPICETNRDDKTVLVPIAGTEKDGLMECKPIHLECAIVQIWDEGMTLAYTIPQKRMKK